MIYEIYLPFMLKREDETEFRTSGVRLGIPAETEDEAIHKVARMITQADVEWFGERPKLDG